MSSGASSAANAAKIDPLILLRRAITGRSDIHLMSQDNVKVFTLSLAFYISLPVQTGRISIPKTLTTRYRKPGAPQEASPATDRDHFYDSQSILCCYLNREKGFAAYIQEANQQGCSFVSATERKAITDFLEGKSGSSEPSSIVALESSLPTYQEYLTNEIGLNGGDVNATSKENSNANLEKGGSTTGSQGQITERPGAELDESRMKRTRYVVDKVDQELVKRIMSLHEHRQVSDRRTVLRGSKAVNFDSARLLVLDRIKARREELKTRLNGTGSSGNLTKPVGPPGSAISQAKRRSMNPIIIISPSSSALITMHNVKRFLEDAVFEPPNVARGGGAQITTTEDVIVVSHRRGYTTSQAPPHPSDSGAFGKSSGPADRAARYFVVDGVEALTKFGEDAWDRVVCVMTTGQEWQFRPYKWSDPKELFHHVKGFFIQWTHDPPNPKVRAWNVTELRIDETKRHIDKSAAADFWRSLEAWIALHKPFVAY
ncbi:accessory factor associated with RNA polymerase II [Puccinia graminis f. sp. tritici]|uniref:Accessory factor associated with RNA polymerase II n=1 Tax=Puccinia graminis f. sp. tritici TaxID=56615 RepID=A0A5B0QLE2_PUCGR|nr:accessory factor associated with RNA polymerase II [Puccinia graminis f. sp. tritici]